jgi:hypothetical protein
MIIKCFVYQHIYSSIQTSNIIKGKWEGQNIWLGVNIYPNNPNGLVVDGVVRVRQMGTIECKEEIIGTGYYAAPFVESHGDLSSLSGYKSTGNDHAFLLVKFFLILPPKTSGMTLKQ